MFCYRCGSSMPDTATVCPQCGAAVQQAPQPAPPPAAAGTPNPPTPQPMGYQPGAPMAQPQYRGQPQESEGKATVSLVLGILSIACFGIFTGIPAVILGHIAKSNIRKSGGRLSGDGKATAGLIMGYFSIALIPLMLALVIPSLLRSRIEANSAAAASRLRTINTSQITYLTQYPTAGYARDLATLGPGPSGTCTEASQEHACLISGATGNINCKAGSWCATSGYLFTMRALSCDGQPCSDYVVVAKPLTTGSTGNKSFCTTSDGIIRWRTGSVSASLTVEECQSWSMVE